ncbi:hypothetical protein SESBI_49461 [Sesbania bispinosa]|nr:hypothetical protein SESBI_49461 [Sesbania bispinosa]
MASTTSAAESMLLSGSINANADGLINPSILESAALPCSQNMATLSASAPFPTITLKLDLTQSATNSSQPQGGPQGFWLRSLCQLQTFLIRAGNGDIFIYRHSKCSNSTAAITADPKFTAALVAAITSIIGSSHPNNNGTSGDHQQCNNTCMRLVLVIMYK